jgi:bacterial/archaeal transporter family protein
MPELPMGSWILWALLSATFAALTAVFAKVGVGGIDSDIATFVRTAVVLAVLATILAVRGLLPSVTEISGRGFTFLALSGLATGASWLCYFRALQIGDAARVAPVDKLSVVLVAVFAAVFLGEHLALHNWLGVVLIAGGALLVAL